MSCSATSTRATTMFVRYGWTEVLTYVGAGLFVLFITVVVGIILWSLWKSISGR